MAAFASLGLVLVLPSFVLWWQRPSTTGARALRAPGSALAFFQSLLFAAWTIGPPLYALWAWRNYPPEPSSFAVYQYDHKLISDVWVSIAVVLGVLFGIKK
jgi:hypothetical protein